MNMRYDMRKGEDVIGIYRWMKDEKNEEDEKNSEFPNLMIQLNTKKSQNWN
jgi:hypothetical protein